MLFTAKLIHFSYPKQIYKILEIFPVSYKPDSIHKVRHPFGRASVSIVIRVKE